MNCKRTNEERTEDNNRLITLALNGDKNALDQLFIANRPLQLHIAKKFLFTGIDYDDLISICALAMYRAYLSFDMSLGYAFGTWAGRYMEGAIWNEVKHDKRHTINSLISVSIDEVIHSEGGRAITFGDKLNDPCVISDPCDIYVEKEEKVILAQIIDELPEKEKILIKALWIEGRSQMEVAELLNTYQVAVSRLEKKIIHTMKERFRKQFT